MASSTPERKRQLIDAVLAQARTQIPNAESEGADLFVERCFEGAPLDELEAAGPDQLCRLADSLLAWARWRPRGDLKLRILNPPAESETPESERTVIEIVTDDMPFLVDSVTGVLSRREITLHLMLHPQVTVRRNAEHQLLEIVPHGLEGDDVVAESVMHLEIDRITAQPALVELETELRKVLAGVRMAVEDWHAMREATARRTDELEAHPAPPGRDELDEVVEFLRWVADDHFTFLGYLELRMEKDGDELYLRPDAGSGLGLLRDLSLAERARGERPVSRADRRFLDGDQLLAITKTDALSTVHRNVHMDLLSVKRFDAEGRLQGEVRLLGLFTSMAYLIPADEIPLLRRKVARVIHRTRFRPSSHDAKALHHILQNYPRDELFQISEDDLCRFALRILELQLRPRLALLVRRDDEGRYATCMVYVPRERHSTELRVRMGKILADAFGGDVTSFATRISERPLAQVQFTVATRPERLRELSFSEVEERLADAARSWSDDLRDLLRVSQGPEEGLELWRRYRDAFPSSYRESFAPEMRDLEILDRVLETGRLGLRLYRREGAAVSRLHLRIFELAVPEPLSSVLPRLENMGLQINTENPFEIRPKDAANPVWVRDFELLIDDFEVDPASVEKRFEDAFLRLWTGEIENDGFNKLVLRAGLDWRQVVVLRAYCRYLRQAGIPFGQRYLESALARHPTIAGHLVELFETRFDPALDDEIRKRRGTALRRRVLDALETVTRRDEDRILFGLLDLILCTLRTNYFQPGDAGEPKDYLSFKLDGRKIRELPAPRPLYEIFVYSPRLEAVHLRGGKVARGGIRWSDRPQDFRTEILGLVKSQMVKNAVIVPVGAKGGFVVKRHLADRDAMQDEAVACYQTMIRGLLDLTDNREGTDRIAPPPAVVRHDGDDPYLVVAADKGTASFSDIANGVAAEYGFWLGDAFASGGSVGYDHKKMAITARGAWESVKRHFRELGRNIQSEPFTAVGVGDMSGDVFGNGMLLSEHTRLVAAFNHLHVFVDPDPDPARSFAERRRLFDLPRSTWADYDEAALSPGGGVFDRHAKEITVSAEIRELFQLDSDTLAPDELIRAALGAAVDLLWFGGIGTYVKASSESHADAGDHANDDLRLDARDLRCQVIGEGANLGVTQAGRIEFALEGGRLNTDFIDNSGGVDCSDHEVNIKIALDSVVAAGGIDREERDRLLAEMTGEVAELVLHDNYLQTQAITLTEARGAALLDQQARLMRILEHAELLDRRLEGLPDDETLAERRDRKLGLTRPEISVLLAISKIDLYNALLSSGLADDRLLAQDLLRYFPKPMQERFPEALETHRLRREIIATYVTNSLINRVGPTFVTRLAEETGAHVGDIARAYAAVREIFDLRSLWQEVENLDNRVAADLQVAMFQESVDMVERATRWFLRNAGRPLDLTSCVERYERNIITVVAQLPDLLPGNARSRVRRRHKRLCDKGIPGALAQRVATMEVQPSACDVARCASLAGVRVERVGKIYFTLAERFGFDRLRREALKLDSGEGWQQTAVTSLIDDLYTHQAELARQVVSYPGGTSTAIKAWIEAHAGTMQRVDEVLADLATGTRVDLAMLTVAERELRRVIEITGPDYDRRDGDDG